MKKGKKIFDRDGWFENRNKQIWKECKPLEFSKIVKIYEFGWKVVLTCIVNM